MSPKPDNQSWHNLFERLDCGLKSVVEHLARPSHPVVINMPQCQCCAETLRQILGIVKDIRKHQGGISSAEEARLAAQLDASTNSLQDAVESNLPPPSTT